MIFTVKWEEDAEMVGQSRAYQRQVEAGRGRKDFGEEERNVRDRGNGMSSIMHQWRVGWFESLLRHTLIISDHGRRLSFFLSFFLSVFLFSLLLLILSPL